MKFMNALRFQSRSRLRTRSALLGLIMLFAVFVIAHPPQRAQPSPASASAKNTPSGNAQHGKQLYISYGCYECHGREGQGSSATGPRLGPDPISFSSFVRHIRQPTAQMPPYAAEVVTDSELMDMYVFLQILPKPSPVNSIPLLN